MGTESKALAVVKELKPTTPRGIALAEALKQETEQRALLRSFVKDHMIEETDYGTIPGTPKPTLYKAGAEKITGLFRCTPKFHFVHREEDFARGFFNYIFRVRLVSRDTKEVLSEGYGSCNSFESKYRYRDAKYKCPKCQKETLFKEKDRKGGFYCWAKKGGCGATFDGDDKAITSQTLGKVENEDRATLQNTILKIAKKRSHVDGTIALAGISDLFTQDEEDTQDEPTPARGGPPEPPPPTDPSSPPPPPNPQCAANGHEWDLKGFCQVCGITEHAASKKKSDDKPAEVKKPTQAPAIRARIAKIWKDAQAAEMHAETFQKWAGEHLGHSKPSSEWTEEEVARLEVAMQGLKSEPGAAG